jgi:hypothetical protein
MMAVMLQACCANSGITSFVSLPLRLVCQSRVHFVDEITSSCWPSLYLQGLGQPGRDEQGMGTVCCSLIHLSNVRSQMFDRARWLPRPFDLSG